MKLLIEPFLLDNTLMNCCVYQLTAAWMGVRVRLFPTVVVSMIGAVYALLSLLFVPILRSPLLKIPCFLILSLLLFRKAGTWRSIPFLLLSAALTGGTAVLLTIQFGGRVYADGTVVGTVPVRIALIIAFAALFLPRAIRRILLVRHRNALHTCVVIRLAAHTYRLDALIDSGNLLNEPLSGLPVVLIDREVDRPLRPIPFEKVSGSGMIFGERPISAKLPEYGNTVIDCFCAKAPERIGTAQAVLPERLLPYDWRTKNVRMDFSYLGAPAHLASRWQKQYLMVRSRKRGTAASTRSGRGSALYRACVDRQGSKG